MQPISQSRLPDFIVIGAAKAATTWVVHQLQQHPGVFMPSPEPHYFSREYDQGVSWYESWFADARDDQIVGEKSADYLADCQAAERIAALLPDARLVVQLRNPIERAYSDYCMLFRRGSVTATPEEYLGPGAEQQRFLGDGLYHRHLARFFDRFPRESLTILLHEDIKRTPEGAIEQVCAHIGVAPRVAAAEVAARVNDGETPMLPLRLRQLLAPMKEAVAPLRDRPWFKSVHAAFARAPQYPPLTVDLRRRLRDFYAADIERLSPVIGRDLNAWLAVEKNDARDSSESPAYASDKKKAGVA